MSSLKFDLPQLDYTTRFSLWQVKMRAILTQSSDLDEALDGFGKKDAKTWTDDEKRKERKAFSLIQLHLSNNILQEVLAEKSAAALWLKLESICMSKDLTSKMHVKMKLFSHKLQEGASMMNHLSIFKEIVSDLLSMEVNRDELTLAEVYEALQQREKMKSMVQQRVRHLRQKLCRSEAGPRTETTTTTEIRARPTEVAQSPRDEMVEHDTEPATYTEAVASVDRVKWISAMQEEMQSLDKNGTWDVVPLPKQKKAVRSSPPGPTPPGNGRHGTAGQSLCQRRAGSLPRHQARRRGRTRLQPQPRAGVAAPRHAHLHRRQRASHHLPLLPPRRARHLQAADTGRGAPTSSAITTKGAAAAEPDRMYDYLQFNLLGLRILKKLARDHDNCGKIGNARGLLAKIVEFLHASQALLLNPRARDKTLRRDVAENVFTVSNLRGVLQHGHQHMELQKLAMNILTGMAMDQRANEQGRRAKIGGQIGGWRRPNRSGHERLPNFRRRSS
ncbi:hypothetical protein QYE76_006753 [Lolium multiflorum]|uniref:Uncharacterized protein n=1 Tax=Lolium multiflorum TaxID=4521 RepID=A0AAD8RWE0_LOLMU|nr:hypothetical protein QYE76_006753 [Lolium multiflorum]